MSGNPISKRRQLGEALAFLRGEMGISKHNLADKTRTTVKIVESWLAGESVPTTQEWQRMRSIFPPLASAASRYAELYRAAAAEQLAFEQTRRDVVPADPDDDTTAAIRMLVDTIPNLRSMTIEVDDAGEISIAFKTREVRVVEASNSMKLRSK